VASDTPAVSTGTTPPAPTLGLDFVSQWHTRRLRALARRHGATTEKQRRRLFDSVVRHVNAGIFSLDDANAFLQTLGIEPAAGPGQVSFRVPVAMAMIHEDAETDIGTFQYRLEEVRMSWTRLDGYSNGFRIARPTRADVETARRHTVVATDLRLTVTVPAYSTRQQLVALATALLREDLPHLREDVDILDEPTLGDTAPQCPGSPDDTDTGGDTGGDTGDGDGDGDGWACHADEFDEGNYINYGLDTEPDEAVDEFDPTRPWRPREIFDGDDETGDEQHDG
jgi:hypothetical protein